MRFFIWSDSPEFLAALGLVVALVIGFAIYQWLRPPAIQKLAGDNRYLEALSVYTANLPTEGEPTREDRFRAHVAAAGYLTEQHAIAEAEADANLRVMVAEYDKERSYELRYDALAYEEAGAYDLALDCFERAARLQEEHDPKDYQFLQRCIQRVRAKAQSKMSG
jgi:tetratricopeptide (TPR) repeat protein